MYDALTTDRPYRRAYPMDEALAIMANDSGRIFDPDLVPRFDQLIRAYPKGDLRLQRFGAPAPAA